MTYVIEDKYCMLIHLTFWSTYSGPRGLSAPPGDFISLMLTLINIVAGRKKEKESSGSRAKMNYLRANIFLTSESLSFFWNVQSEWYIDFLQHTLHFSLIGIKVMEASVKWAQNSLLHVNKIHSFNQI